ncbi:MAG: MBL fold metallo-hydrolase [Leptospirillum sp.]
MSASLPSFPDHPSSFLSSADELSDQLSPGRKSLDVLFLGTGASSGVPVIGCSCPVCISTDKKNRRTRSSVLVRCAGKNLLIDTSPDLRYQSLKNGVVTIDGVIFTHPHADHVLGLDELRIFNYIQKREIPVYADSYTLSRVQMMFPYAFSEANRGGLSRPKLIPHEITGPADILGMSVISFPVYHGPVMNHAVRINDLVYLTDCKGIPDESWEALYGVETLIVGAVKYEPHESHFGIHEALALIERLNPKRAFITHLSHSLEHEELSRMLPPSVFVAYDGLRITTGGP